MMEYDTFWGLDQATWLDIFSLLKVLVPGLVMVCFGVYYQLRKKTETAIKIEIAKFRIFAYTDIAYTYSKLANLVSPTLQDETKLKFILSNYGYIDFSTSYSLIVGTERGFDSFYDDISAKLKENEIYLDYKVNKQCLNAIGVFTELKQFLDAFCDAEWYLNKGKDVNETQEKIDFAYLLTAVFMQNEINKASLLVTDVIAEQINGIRVSYRKYRVRKMLYRLYEFVLRFADKYMNDHSWKGWLSSKILYKSLKDRLSLITKMPTLVEIFAYLHVSDKYSPSSYFSMDEDKRLKVSADFMKCYYLQLHHNR